MLEPYGRCAGGGGGNVRVGDRKGLQRVTVGGVVEHAVEVGGASVDHAADCSGELLIDVACGRGIVFAEVVAVGDVDDLIFSGTDDEVMHNAACVRLIGQEESAGGAEIEV